MSDRGKDEAERDEQADETKRQVPSPARGASRNYYYDDATGYELFVPDEDGEEESAEESSAGPASTFEAEI